MVVEKYARESCEEKFTFSIWFSFLWFEDKIVTEPKKLLFVRLIHVLKMNNKTELKIVY